MSDQLPTDELPSPLPPRDFSTTSNRFFYYISAPEILIILFLYFWAVIYAVWFSVTYYKQERDYAQKSYVHAKILKIEADYYEQENYELSRFTVSYQNKNGEQITTTFEQENRKGETTQTAFQKEQKENKLYPIVFEQEVSNKEEEQIYKTGDNMFVFMDEQGQVCVNDTSNFYHLDYFLILLAFWIFVPLYTLIYYLRQRIAALKFYQLGLRAKAKLQKIEQSSLSTVDYPTQLYIFAYQAFNDETYTLKLTAPPYTWDEDRKNEVLVLYHLRQPEQALIMDTFTAAPIIKENGLLIQKISPLSIYIAAIMIFVMACCPIYVTLTLLGVL